MPVIRFGLFEFDAASGALTREGVSVRLQPQPARVLAVLVQRAGELVSRDELRTAIWGDATYVDFERGLNFCIAQIRSALGDSAESPRFIETLPRRGYRFIAPATEIDPAAAPAGPSTRAKGSSLRAGPSGREIGSSLGTGPSRRTAWIVAASVGLLLLLAAAAASIRFATGFNSPDGSLAQGKPGGGPIRVAVVPFDNETGSTEYDQIAGGVADATVARLATPERLDRVAVVGNAAILRRPRAFRDLKAIGKELQAQYVVLAQVKSDGGRARLIAHLIRVEDEAHIWANTFDRPSFGLDVQAELAETIARSVVERVGR